MKPRNSHYLRWRSRMRSTPQIVGCFAVLFFVMMDRSEPVSAQTYEAISPVDVKPFMNGEKLKYKVKWGFFNLGSAEVSQGLLQDTGDDMFCLSAQTQSAPWLPFVHVDFEDSAFLRPDHPSNLWFHFVDNRSKSWATYSHDSGSTSLLMSGYDPEEDSVTKTLDEKSPVYDALGLFMLIRELSGSGLEVRVPVVVDYKLKSIELKFHRRTEAIRVPAFKGRILAHRFESMGNWSDKYADGAHATVTGWVSADSAAVPLFFKMKILVGSIDVKLASYVRPGWIPPTVPSSTEIEAAVDARNK